MSTSEDRYDQARRELFGDDREQRELAAVELASAPGYVAGLWGIIIGALGYAAWRILRRGAPR